MRESLASLSYTTNCCSSCVCCCYNGTSAFVDKLPSTDCGCKTSFRGSDIKLAITLAVMVLVPTLLASLYLGGQLCISPYKKAR
jgi:hypothetical protein